MKKIIALSFVFAVAAFSVSAQQTREIKDHKDRQMGQRNGQMMKDLNLTDAQKAEMKANREAMKSKMDAIKNDPNLSDEQKKEKAKSLMQEQRTKMQSMLTTEQKVKMESQKDAMEAKRGEMGKKKEEMGDKKEMGEEHSMEMKEKLGLSNDQAAKLKALNEQTRTKIQAIHSNSSLTQEQKQAEMKTVKEAAKTQSQSILTKEQQKKMKSIQKETKGKHDKMNGNRKGNKKRPQTT